MCGIFASVSVPLFADEAERALRALRHRGPDGQGTWRNRRGDVLLAHTRLSIIDPPGGAQPLVNETGDVAAIVNGEFYGYERIMADLADGGHRFRSRCDSEILLHLYEDCGLDAVRHLRGEFAFAVWDEVRSRLVAGRDRFGVKPLFYWASPAGLRIASEAKALFAGGVTAEWDEEALYQHLFFIHDAPRSLFSGIRQVPAGHLLVFEGGCARPVRYWDLDYPFHCDSAAGDEEEAIEELEDRLRDAVRVRLRADTPVGYFLSGGIDSSAVVGFASRHWDAPGRAFTVRFDEAAYDESDVAQRTARDVGAAFTPIPLSHDDLVEAYPRAIAHAETTGSFHAAARYLQCRAVNQAGYKVALTGDGADEVLAGYVHYRGDAASEGDERLPAALEPMRVRLGHVPHWVRMLAIERSVFNLLLSHDYKERMRWRRPYADCLDALDCDGQLVGRHPLHQSLYLWNKTMLPNYVLGAERLEMAFGVETRPPFLDHVLFDSIRRLPPALLVGARQGKRALRRAAAGVVSEAVRNGGKHPFAAPARLADPHSALHRHVDGMFRSGVLDAMGFFDAAAVLTLWTQFPTMPAAQQFALEPILLITFGACVLHERYVA